MKPVVRSDDFLDGKPCYIAWGRNASFMGKNFGGGACVYRGESVEVLDMLFHYQGVTKKHDERRRVMTPTIETIDGKPYTVVWHSKPLPIQQGLDDGMLFLVETSHGYELCVIVGYPDDTVDRGSIATALPPLPRYPTFKDAALLYRYMAEGASICCSIGGEEDVPLLHAHGLKYFIVEITHATLNGERVEVAIEEREARHA